MIPEGATAPDFYLLGTDGEEIDDYRLSEYTEDGAVVLTFYLFDFHPACTGALCSVRDAEWLEFTPGVDVFGISTDKVFSHRAFADEMGFEFPLLSDDDGGVSESYGVLQDSFRGHQRVAERAAFVIGSEQTVRYAWSSDDPKAYPDLEEIATVARTVTESV